MVVLQTITLQPRKRITFLQALRRKVEETTLLPGVRVRVPLTAKLATASLLVPPVRVFALGAARKTGVRAAKVLSTPLGIGGVLTGAGAITTSPTLRGVLKSALSPKATFRRGRGLGAIIEDPSKLLPAGKTAGEKVRDILKEAGPAAAGAAALTAAAVAVTRRIRAGPKTPAQAPPIGLLPSIPSLTPSTQPLGAVEKPIEPEAIVAAQPVSMPSIKITNKPQINIRFSKSRRFINQQVLVK